MEELHSNSTPIIFWLIVLGILLAIVVWLIVSSKPIAAKKVKDQEMEEDIDELMLERLTSIDKNLKMLKWPVFLASVYLLSALIREMMKN